MLYPSIQRHLALAVLLAAITPSCLLALGRSDLRNLPTQSVDGVSCTLSDAIRAANNGTVVGGCSGSPGIEILVLDADVVLTTADTTHSTLLGGAHAGLPDVTSAIILDAGSGSLIERDASFPCGSEEATAFRIFNVPADGALYLFGVTLRNGCVAPGSGVLAHGGAIYVEDGELELHDVTIENSSIYGMAAGDSGALGGAFACLGGSIPSVRNTIFRSNLARGVDGQASSTQARGGAGALDQCSLGTLEDSVFELNTATGSSDDNSTALGGGLSLRNSTWDRGEGLSFLQNLARGGTDSAGSGSGAAGGAINLDNSPVDAVLGSVFRGNQALSGGSPTSSGGLAEGGAIHLSSFDAAIGEIGDCIFEDNLARGGDVTSSGSPGDASGGALSGGRNTTIDRIHSSLFRNNRTQAGFKPGTGGGSRSEGGALFTGGRIGEVDRVTFMGNQALGGAGSVGARGRGGALAISSGELDLVLNSTFVGNRAVGGTDNDPGDPGGFGRGGAIAIENDTPTVLYANTFVGNEAQGGTGAAGSGEALGGAVSMSDFGAGATLAGNLLTGNRVLLDDGTATLEGCVDNTGVLVSAGWNQVESPGDCLFGSTGDQTGSPVAVHALADWGCASTLPDGSCLPTVAIDQSSAAVDQGSCSVTATLEDAREVVRPFDLPAVADADDGCDVGAFEAVDSDGDGFTEAADCAPDDATVHAVDACGTCGGDGSACTIFDDGFESGTLSAWASLG